MIEEYGIGEIVWVRSMIGDDWIGVVIGKRMSTTMGRVKLSDIVYDVLYNDDVRIVRPVFMMKMSG
jgi:hypothetical protein